MTIIIIFILCISFQITSLADLDGLMERMRSKPMVTTALCSKPYTDQHKRERYDTQSSDNQRSTHTEEYVATVNTNHPEIQRMFQEVYDETKQLIEQGKTFRVTVNVIIFIDFSLVDHASVLERLYCGVLATGD